MKLFHGTSYKRGIQILNDKMIKGKNVERVYSSDNINLPTTDGYVYLTEFTKSVYYANKTSLIYDKDDQLIIFEVEVDENVIEPDMDEIEYTLKPFNRTEGFKDIDNPTVQECWDECKALRVGGDVPLIPGNFKYAILKSNLTLSDETKFTMKIVDLRDNFNEYADSLKQELYNQIDWKTE